MSNEADTTGRIDPPLTGSELEMLNTFLDYHRATLLWKVRGVSDEDIRRASVPTSTMTLLGLVKHLAYVERSWFQHRFKKDTVTFPWTKEDPDADWRIEPDETTEGVIRLYNEECEKSRQVVAAASLDEKAARSWADGNSPSLRWIMYHMIEETARHNGHADLLREAIDGATGE
jgi:uncharacterized damage-inducible protein DinB